ncbi:MAG: NADH-quinone oxidoreductase subunit C [Candidatus Krumholzibacteria bacterium]|nr:NADH-quinone oxidoreductase subunit C [Candidatus Krumholzibacteria bacterium]
MKDTIDKIRSMFDGGDADEKREDLVFVTVPATQVVDCLGYLRDRAGYRHLVMISAVDYIERGVFQLTYLLHSYEKQNDIGIRADIGRDDASMDSIHRLWAAAQVYQRELREMFGIDFPGSPRVDEPMLLEGWEGIPPMRRDFDTKKYSEETFFPREGRKTADPATHMAEKNYASEEQVKRSVKDLVRGRRKRKGNDG